MHLEPVRIFMSIMRFVGNITGSAEASQYKKPDPVSKCNYRNPRLGRNCYVD
jgi:hypothetical protein